MIYSHRSATIGSTRDARSAGIAHAMNATATSSSAVPNTLAESKEPMPYSRLCMARVRAVLRANHCAVATFRHSDSIRKSWPNRFELSAVSFRAQKPSGPDYATEMRLSTRLVLTVSKGTRKGCARFKFGVTARSFP